MKDERFKEIMFGLDFPNSRSLLQALEQVANEVAQEKEKEIAELKDLCREFSSVARVSINNNHAIVDLCDRWFQVRNQKG